MKSPEINYLKALFPLNLPNKLVNSVNAPPGVDRHMLVRGTGWYKQEQKIETLIKCRMSNIAQFSFTYEQNNIRKSLGFCQMGLYIETIGSKITSFLSVKSD
jgi:hypothetical protein